MLTAVKNWLRSKTFDPSQQSFSQNGEDKIINVIAKIIRINDIYYLDIGACHPYFLSNTYFFYIAGASGVCVEANPDRARLIKKHRARDVCLNFGVCGDTDTVETRTLNIMRSAAMSTFLPEFAQDSGSDLLETADVQMISVNELIRNYCKRTPNLVSLDVEGMDEEIMRSFDFESHGPEMLCVETLTHGTGQIKRHDLIRFIVDKGYHVVADTYVNTIFVRSDVWSVARPSTPSTIFPDDAGAVSSRT